MRPDGASQLWSHTVLQGAPALSWLGLQLGVPGDPQPLQCWEQRELRDLLPELNSVFPVEMFCGEVLGLG